VIGWANASVRDGRLAVASRFVGSAPAEPQFREELKRERERLIEFLGL
jgi:hypothetical protein